MGEAQKASGPDLTAGVPFETLGEGAPLAGIVDGEGVVLVRRGDEVCAIAAQCSHYGGPLGEGLVVGDTIRWPWHHARFDLRTGEPVGAPAMQTIACYDVVREGGLVRVTGRRGAQPAPTPPAPPKSVVLVGAGAA